MGALLGTALATIGGSLLNGIFGSRSTSKAQKQDFNNNLELAKYNNEYNYNLWKEQMLYNSPQNQVERLKAAGLNPNYQSIEGAGNASNPPTSQIPTHLSNRRDVALQNNLLRLNTINSITNQVQKLIQNMSNLSGVPSSIPDARNAALVLLRNSLRKDRQESFTRDINNMFDAYQKLGMDFTGFYSNSQEPLSSFDGFTGESLLVDMSKAPLAQKIGLTNANLQLQSEIRDFEKQIKKYDLDHLKPMEKKVLESRAILIGLQAGLTGKQLKWFTATAVSKTVAMGIGSLLGIAKLF